VVLLWLCIATMLEKIKIGSRVQMDGGWVAGLRYVLYLK
jgi:hypothetical protein